MTDRMAQVVSLDAARPSAKEARYCRDCAHIRLTTYGDGYEFAKCALAPNVVSGMASGYCDISRKYGPCGPDGELWVKATRPAKRRPWWKRIFT